MRLWTDGACSGNPGRGGYAALLMATLANGQVHEKVISQGFRQTTNNRMELLAVIAGLEALRYPSNVVIHSDSQYVVNAINKGWLASWHKMNWKRRQKPIPNADLWQRLIKALEPHSASFIWVRGHNGNANNERVDQLAVAAASAFNLLTDEGYEAS